MGTSNCSGAANSEYVGWYTLDTEVNAQKCVPVAQVAKPTPGSQHVLAATLGTDGMLRVTIDGTEVLETGKHSQLLGVAVGFEAERLGFNALGPTSVADVEYTDGSAWTRWSPSVCSSVGGQSSTKTCTAQSSSGTVTVSCQPQLADLDFSAYPSGAAVTRGVSFEVSGGTDKNPHYKKSLRLRARYSWVELTLDRAATATTPVWAGLGLVHLSSFSKKCQGNGYSPITITVNGTAVVQDFSPPEHSYTTDVWDIGSSLKAGSNTVKIQAGNTCTHYWLRRARVAIVER